MTYNTMADAAENPQAAVDQKLVTASNLVFAANNTGFGVISLADTGLATSVNEHDKNPTFVPEPSTLIAGTLLLLPFVASVVRIVRKVRTA